MADFTISIVQDGIIYTGESPVPGWQYPENHRRSSGKHSYRCQSIPLTPTLQTQFLTLEDPSPILRRPVLTGFSGQITLTFEEQMRMIQVSERQASWRFGFWTGISLVKGLRWKCSHFGDTVRKGEGFPCG
jgi:hypothetical protein